MKIDNTDKKLLNALLENARLSYRQLAKKTGVSVATVMNHIKKLEKEKIITGYAATLDYEQLEYDIEVTISIKVVKGKLLETESKMAANPHVIAVFDVTGDFDCLVLARFKNTRALDTFLKRIQKYEFIERTHTTLILNTIKDTQMQL